MKTTFCLISFISPLLMCAQPASEVVASENPNNVPIGVIIAIAILGILALALGYISYTLYSKLVEVEKNTQSLKNELSNINNKFDKSVVALTDKLNTLTKSITVTKEVRTPAEEPQPMAKPQIKPVVSDIKRRTMYGTMPFRGIFKSLEESFIAGDSIYEMEVGDSIGEYRVSSRPEAAIVARRAIADFIESACYIDSGNPGNFSRIVTLEPGKIKREGNSWKIIEKATIKFE